MKKRRMIKKRWIVISIVLLVIIVVLGALYLLQQDNLKAAANARRYTQEQLQAQLAENRQAIEDTLSQQYPTIQVRDLTDEEKDALREGSMTREELIEALTGAEPTPSAAPEQPSASPAPEEDPAGEETPVPTAAPVVTAPSQPTGEEEYSEALSALIAEVYVMREEFSSELEKLAAEAKKEYKAMPAEDRTKAKLLSWASGYVTKASTLEKECDSKMDDIVSRLSTLVSRYKQDPSIIQTLVYSYAQEKSIQKSLYIQELEKRGIM